MITLIFVICLEALCVAESPPDIFPSVAECEAVGESTRAQNYLEAERGNIPKHIAIYKCVDWGAPV